MHYLEAFDEQRMCDLTADVKRPLALNCITLRNAALFLAYATARQKQHALADSRSDRILQNFCRCCGKDATWKLVTPIWSFGFLLVEIADLC